MPKLIDLAGMKFGRLVALKIAERRKGAVLWECVCDCGNKTSVSSYNLRHGRTKSCGCFGQEVRSRNGRANFKHGKSNSSEYGSWSAMLQRCNNKNNNAYNYYGGRGIKVCKRWSNFENFLKDMGVKPTKKHQIDRKNNKGNYELANCMWSTPRINSNNRNNTLFIDHNGDKRSIAYLARKYKLNYGTLIYRLKKGVEIEEALHRRPQTGVPYIAYHKSKQKQEATV